MAITVAPGSAVMPGRVGLLLLALSWIVTRAILLSHTLTGSVPLDVVAYARWASTASAGGSPSSDSAFVYPPGSNAIFVIVDWLGVASYYRTFTLLACLMDLLILLSLLAFVRHSDRTRLVGPWAWVVMGFAAGPLMYERYDVFAALFGCLAVLVISRPALSGALAGVGFIIKLWPEIALLGLPRARLMRGLVANVLTVGVGWLAFELLWGDSLSFVGNVMNKGLSVEAVAAYPFLLLRYFSQSHGVTGQFGSWEVVGEGVALASTATSVLAVLLLVGILALRVMGRLEHAAPGDVVLLGVLIFVAAHKINSLQYGVWIAAMTAAALAYASSRAMGPAVLLTLMLLIADQVIWVSFVPFISGNPIMLAFQGMRLALLIGAILWLAVAIWRSQPQPGEEARGDQLLST